MKCDRCEAEMFQAKMEVAPAGEVYLMNKKKGIFESEKRHMPYASHGHTTPAQ